MELNDWVRGLEKIYCICVNCLRIPSWIELYFVWYIFVDLVWNVIYSLLVLVLLV